jgi:hypothetical protein
MPSRLAPEPISEGALRARILDRLFAVEDGMFERGAHNRKQAKPAVMAIFRREGSAGDTRGGAPGTKWCAANAIAEYADLGRPYTKRSNQAQRTSRTHSSYSADSNSCSPASPGSTSYRGPAGRATATEPLRPRAGGTVKRP